MKAVSIRSGVKYCEGWLSRLFSVITTESRPDLPQTITLGLYFSLFLNLVFVAGWNLSYLIIPVTMLMVFRYRLPGVLLSSGLVAGWLSVFLFVGWMESALLAALLIIANALAGFLSWRQARVIDALRDGLKAASQESVCDPLTGLLNRRGFLRKAELIAQQARQNDRGFALMMIDLDDFKQINDTYGHQVGDQVLVNVSRALARVLRTEDLASRHGGEEFLLLLNTDDAEALAAICRRLENAVAELRFPKSAAKLKVTFSAGLATSLEINSLAALTTLADQRLYAAKLAGKNQVISRSLYPIRSAQM